MNILYFDCFSGVSGDMLVGSLLDCGANWAELQAGIDSLEIGARIGVCKQIRQGISCSSFVVTADSPPLRHLEDIKRIISHSTLSQAVKFSSVSVFDKLASAEATVHGITPEEVHFHEIGAVDTIVDIVGTFLCLETLGIEQCFASSLPWSQGFAEISHGRYPLPAPATAILLQDYPCHPVSVQLELVTPTGAALLTSIAAQGATLPTFIPVRTGYGAGLFERADGVPNLLRVVQATISEPSGNQDMVAILETEIDDMNPEVFSHLGRIMAEHSDVVDYFITPVFMKKNRPGSLITILARPAGTEELCYLIIRETGSLGVRHRLQKRILADRHEDSMATPWGPVRIKIARLGMDEIRVKPEFEDCAAIAQRERLPILKVYEAVNSLLGARSRVLE